MELQSSVLQTVDFAIKSANEQHPQLAELDHLQLAMVGGGIADVVVR